MVTGYAWITMLTANDIIKTVKMNNYGHIPTLLTSYLTIRTSMFANQQLSI